MSLQDDGFWYLPLKDTNVQDDIYHTAVPTTPRYTSQESNVGTLYLDNGPWIIQNMDIDQPPPKGAHSSNLESAMSSCSQAPTSRVKVPLSSIRQRTAQACDKCRERKTKCSGHRPFCLRCTTRGLVCEYSARETRLRSPTRSRFHPGHIRPMTVMQQYALQPHSRLRNDLPVVGNCEGTRPLSYLYGFDQ